MRLISRHSDVVSQLLPTESFDIGIAELPIDETQVEVRRYGMRCVAILPPRHALASRRVLTPQLLRRVSDGDAGAFASGARTGSAASSSAAGVQIERRGRGGVLRQRCAAWSRAGTGWSIVDPLSARSFAHLGLVARPFEPAITYEIGAF